MALEDTTLQASKTFVYQACAIFLEDAVYEIWSKRAGGKQGPPSALTKTLGLVYVWVFAGWAWSYYGEGLARADPNYGHIGLLEKVLNLF